MKVKKITVALLSAVMALTMIVFSDFNDIFKCIIETTRVSAEEDKTVEFLNSSFDANDLTVYDGTDTSKSFNMNGRTYYQGLKFYCGAYSSYTQFNVENVNTLSFTIGHVDNTNMQNATLKITLDGNGEDEIALSGRMNLMEYTLDVSNASVVRFYIENEDYTGPTYAFGDISVDSNLEIKSCVIPEYETAESFIATGFNKNDLTVYDGSSKTNIFNMNGRTYYQGLKFYCGAYSSYAQFNVENINTLSFTIGHVDNTNMQNATLKITLDGNGEDEIALSGRMNLMEYTLDVSNASVVCFYIENEDYTGPTYAFGDISVDSNSEIKSCVIPEYETAENFIAAGFNKNDLTVYDGSSKTNSFNMNGRTYYQGLTFYCGAYSSYTQFNVENMHSISFTMGHVDNTNTQNAIFKIFLDNEKIEEIELTSEMMLVERAIDVSDASVLYFYIENKDYTGPVYALADISIDTCPCAVSDEICTVCGKNCAHIYTDGVCSICGKKCSHTAYVNGICTICSSACEHSFSGGACEICGHICEHDYIIGVCQICGTSCVHENFTDGICNTCSIMLGDANLDGKINVRDAATIASALAKGTVKNIPISADYNNDGSINVRDAAAIASWLAKGGK